MVGVASNSGGTWLDEYVGVNVGVRVAVGAGEA
jgi:hypothetical protein